MRDTLRLTNGFAAAPQDLLPRLARCFLVTDHAAAQRLAAAHPDCYFLLPDGVSYHGHTVTGGKKSSRRPAGSEARTARTRPRRWKLASAKPTTLTSELGRAGTAAWRYLSEELEQVRAQQQAQEKDALALDHEQRKLAEEYARAGSRLSVARLELERLAREDERSRAQREQQSGAGGRERSKPASIRKKRWKSPAANSTGLQAHVHAIGEEHARTARRAGRPRRTRCARRRPRRHASKRRSAQLTARREELTRDLERMGVERARLLADNIELDQRAAAAGRSTPLRPPRGSNC